jgi:tetratricopeptide (TPR) repeat protein
MRLFLAIIISLLTALPSYCVTREELNRQIDRANEQRLSDSRSSIEPLYGLFVTANENNFADESARTLTYLGWALYDCKYPDLAIQVLTYAQEYCNVDDTKTRDLIALGLGACYAEKNEYAKGEKQLLKSLEQSEKDGNRREVMMIYTYLGDLYSSQAKDSKARECFEKGREIAHEIKDTIFEGALYCNIGILCSDNQEAENYLFKSIDLSQQADNKRTECYAYINLSELYFNQKEYAKALRTAEQFNRFLPYIDPNDQIIAYSHNLLSSIYAEQGDYGSAYNQMVQTSKQQTVDFNQVAKERAKYNELVIDLVKQVEMSKLRQQKQESTNTLAILAVVIVAVMATALTFFLLYRKSQAKSRLLASQNEEILKLQATETRQSNEISDSRRTMNYLYGFYRGRSAHLDKLSQMVKDSYKMNSQQLTAHLRMINHAITQCFTKDKEPEFIKQLEAENEAFIQRLTAKYPDLSKIDIMLATSYRLGLSTRDIARLTGKLPTTVTTARYRLRTSLNIPEDTDLTAFFNAI